MSRTPLHTCPYILKYPFMPAVIYQFLTDQSFIHPPLSALLWASPTAAAPGEAFPRGKGDFPQNLSITVPHGCLSKYFYKIRHDCLMQQDQSHV